MQRRMCVKKNLDMTEGKPISLLWAFTFPTLMGNLLNQVYSITDSIVVGRYLGQTALAAVGSTMPVILLLAALMIGINVGVGIIISRYFGQKNEELMRRAFVNSLYLGLFLSAGMMVMGLTFSGTILRWMGTPEGPLQEATAYLEISFITMICPLMYYLFSSAFRGLGDSQTALYCLIVSVLSNIGLDVLFVAVFRWGVAGSAWATALAQALSAVVAAVLLFRKYPMMRMRRQDLRLHGKLLRQITVLAIPIAVQSAFNNLGNLVAQSAVNLFGEATMAAYTAASRIGTLALMPVETHRFLPQRLCLPEPRSRQAAAHPARGTGLPAAVSGGQHRAGSVSAALRPPDGRVVPRRAVCGDPDCGAAVSADHGGAGDPGRCDAGVSAGAPRR